MKVKLRQNEKFFAQVEFIDVNYSFINSIRRSLVSMVPCLAIHEVDFHMGSLGSYVEEELLAVRFTDPDDLLDEDDED